MSSLNGWLSENKLTPNLAKSNYIVIPSTKNNTIDNLNIFLRGTRLQKVKKATYLGVQLDENLNWKEHIDSLCSKISPVVGVLSKVRWVLPERICRLLYMSLIHCHLMYCLEVWGCASNLALHPLEVIQKRIIRLMSFAPYQSHTAHLFESLEIMTVRKLYLYKICVLVQKEITGVTRTKHFNFNFVNHIYPTRSNCRRNLRIPSITSNISNRALCCFKYIGPRCYNIFASSS